MRLIRNTTPDGKCKYALVRLDKLRPDTVDPQAHEAIKILHDKGLMEFGLPNSDDEFFVIKLRDEFATGALKEYAMVALPADPEFAQDVWRLATRSGPNHPKCKRPD